MSFLENIIWFIFGGCILGCAWLITGMLWCISIVGIPIGIQCFKIALIAFCPFGKDLTNNGKASSFILNVLWIVFGGIELSAVSVAIGIVFCVTVVGIPFGIQFFKLAIIGLMPFGTRIR